MTLVLLFYVEILAHAPATGQDFRNFYAAATVLSHGGNPYDSRQLLHAEDLLYRPATAAQRASLAGNPYVQGPLLAIALLPSLGVSPSSAYTVYATLLTAAAALALAILAGLWPTCRPRQRLGLLLISPVTFLGVLLGQPDAVLLLLLVAALALCRRHPALAGVILALGLIKPQIMAGPIILLGVLSWRHGRLRRYAAGLLGGIALFLGSSLAIAGPAVVWAWGRALVGFGGDTVYTQVDISALTTLYVGWAPHALSLALAVTGVIAWLVLCFYTGRTGRARDDDRWWLALGLTGWLLVTPYAHPHDDVLLLPAVWYLLDRLSVRAAWRLAGRRAPGNRALALTTMGLAVLLLVSWWLLPMTSVLGLRPPLIRGLGIVPVLLLCVLLALRRPKRAIHSRPPAASSPDRAIGAHRIAS